MSVSIPRDYHLTAKGEDFLDEFYSHWQGAGDPAHVIQFLWWLRERGNFQIQLQELIERQGEIKALQAVNWAVDKRYLEADTRSGREYDPTVDPEEDKICQACGLEYTPPAPDDWGLSTVPVCDKCFTKGHR